MKLHLDSNGEQLQLHKEFISKSILLNMDFFKEEEGEAEEENKEEKREEEEEKTEEKIRSEKEKLKIDKEEVQTDKETVKANKTRRDMRRGEKEKQVKEKKRETQVKKKETSQIDDLKKKQEVKDMELQLEEKRSIEIHKINRLELPSMHDYMKLIETPKSHSKWKL